jgi:hypothetical protein
LKHLGVKLYDRDFNPRFRNFAFVQQHVNRWINSDLGIKAKERSQLSLAQLKEYEEAGRFDLLVQKGIDHYTAISKKK